MTEEEYSVGFLFAVALSMVDGVVSGQVLGMDALAATSLVFPLVSLTTFLSNIITTGCSNLCAIAKGNGDHEKARSLFTLGLFATILLGQMQSVIYYFTEDLYFDYYAAPGNIGNLHGCSCSFVISFIDSKDIKAVTLQEGKLPEIIGLTGWVRAPSILR